MKLFINFYENKAKWADTNFKGQGYEEILTTQYIPDLTDSSKKYTKAENVLLKRYAKQGYFALNAMIGRSFNALRQQSKKLGFDLAKYEYYVAINKYNILIAERYAKKYAKTYTDIEYVADLVNKKLKSIYGKPDRQLAFTVACQYVTNNVNKCSDASLSNCTKDTIVIVTTPKCKNSEVLKAYEKAQSVYNSFWEVTHV